MALKLIHHPSDPDYSNVALANNTPEIRAVIETLANFDPPVEPHLWGNFIVACGTRAQMRVLDDGRNHLLPQKTLNKLRPSERLVGRTYIASESMRLDALERVAAAIAYAGLNIDDDALSYTAPKIADEVRAIINFFDDGQFDLVVDNALAHMSPTMRLGIRDILDSFPTPPLQRLLEL